MTDLAAAQPPNSAPAAKETKAQKAERLKLAKNPWEAWDEVRQFAREGRTAVLPEWAEFYFKWWGVYTQGDGLGVTGGKDVEISVKIDPSIIGGLVVKLGSRMVDGWLKTKLNSIRTRMKEVG